MRRNSKRKAILHSAMRPNTIARSSGRGPLVWTILALAAAALVAGGWLAYVKLHGVWIEQCVVTDLSRQVTVTTGANIKPGLVLELFGLRQGANLAQIDFAAKRDEVMKKVPNVKSLTISRRLPDRVEITVVEREPVARMNIKGNGGKVTGRVADADGVVFVRQAGTQLLPTIYEQKSPFTAVGKTLTGRSRAALELVCACQDSEFSELGVMNIDTTRKDFLVAILGGNYAEATIAWEGMDGPPSASSARAMRRQLSRLRDARRTASGINVRKWNATIPNRAFADTMEPIR